MRQNSGQPSEAGTYQDAEAACLWLQGRGFEPRRIIAFGESLGGGVVSELALRQPLGGLVLQSTFTSIPDVGAELFPWMPVHWLSTIHYDTHRRLPRLKLPVLVMHSRADGLIPFHHAEKNYAVANSPKLFCELQGGHNDSLAHPEAFVAGLERFLRLVESPQTGARQDSVA